MSPVGVQVPVAGSYSSALLRTWTKLLSSPPATSTLPLGSNVAECSNRGVTRLPVAMKTPESAAHGCTRSSPVPRRSSGTATRRARPEVADRRPAARKCNIFIGLGLHVVNCSNRFGTKRTAHAVALHPGFTASCRLQLSQHRSYCSSRAQWRCSCREQELPQGPIPNRWLVE
jgi:hypothetical protein